MAQRRNAYSAAIDGLESDPAEAAEALKIGDNSNVPAALAQVDVEGYQRQQRAALVSSILNGNQTLRDYALGHPLAPKISSKDWGQLDAITHALDVFSAPSSMLIAGARGFKEGMEATGPIGSWIDDKWGLLPLPRAELAALGYIPELSTHVFSGIVEGLRQSAIAGYRTNGGDPNQAEQFGNEMAQMAQAELMGMSGRVPVGEPSARGVAAFQIGRAVKDAARLAKPYLDEGKVPPIGLHPLIDTLHLEQAKLDAKNLDSVVKESSSSETRTLAPEFFADQFLRRKTNASILVDAEAVRKLYGDKVPTPGDNLLGWVKGIQDQLAVAEEDGGGKITIPIADWAAHVDPEVDKALKDDIQFRPGGLTLNEGKELVARPEAEPKADGGQELEPAINPDKQTVDSLREATNLRAPLTTALDEAPHGLREAEDTKRLSIIPPDKTVTHTFDLSSYGAGTVKATGASVRDIIDHVDTSHLDGVPKLMYGFIGSKLKELVGNVPVSIVEPEDVGPIWRAWGLDPKYPAFYDPRQKRILWNRDFAEAPHYNFATETILHEATHAMTHDAIESFPELKKLIDDLREYTKKFLDENSPSRAERYDYYLTAKGDKRGAPHEFMAGSWSHPGFQNTLAGIPLPKELAERLGFHTPNAKISSWDAFAGIIRKAIERITGLKFGQPRMLEALLRVGPTFERANELLREAKREPTTAAATATDRPLAQEAPSNLSSQIARLLGKARGDKYLESMSARDVEDAEFQTKIAEQRARQQQTSEWQANRQAMRAQVADDIRERPAIAADIFFRNGELYGEKVRKPKLDRKAVPADLQKLIPEGYMADRGGIHPDAAAGFFGHQTGRAMLEDLARLHADREEAGLTPSAHLTSLIEAETDRRMNATYGTLEQSILEETKDHILGPSELDRLHEDMMALNVIHQGGKDDMPGAEQLKWNKAAVKSRVRENVATGRYGNMGQISSDHFLDQVGRLGRKIEDALQDGEYHDAFKLSQQRLIAAHVATEVKKLERAKDRFDRAVKNWRKREPSGLRQEDAIWIHQILSQIGLPARRSVQDLEQQRELISPHSNLREYYNEVNKAHDTNPQDPDAMPAVQNLNIMEDLFSTNWRKSVEDMTPEEFIGVYNSLKSIDNWGRNAKKSDVRGNKEDTARVVDGLVERLKASVDNKIQATSGEDKSTGRTIGSLLLNPETWFKRLDLGNRLGPFSQLIVRPITEGQHQLRSFEREFAAKWRDLGEPKDFNAKVENTLFRDPDGDLIPMTRGHAIAVLSNMGNKLQRAKLVLGWKIDNDIARGEQKVWDWLQKVGIGPEDLVRAQKLGKVFEAAFEKSEAAWVHTAGVAPARIDLGAMHTPWGVSEEWYHPLIPHPIYKNVKLTADDMLNESGFYRPSPSHGYTKLRTGAIYPIDLSYDSIPFKLKQILNDAAMRIPITEVNKIVYHDAFQTAFKKYYGPEYSSALDAWIKDTAGNRQWVPGNLKSLDMAINAIQRNLSTLLIGFNMGTVAKHAPTAAAFSIREVGAKHFFDSLLHMIYELPGSRERWNFAMESSEELQNRMNHIQDTLIVANRELFSNKTGLRRKFDTFRDTIEKWGHAPVGYTDLYSAVAMWDAEYRRLGEAYPDMTHGDKVYSANTAVRQTHGSSILSNRPGIMRYHSPMARLAMPFYNFFNNALQRMYEQAWKSKLALQGRELPEMQGFTEEKFEAGPQHIKSIIGGLMVFGVISSLIEQMVDPIPQGKGESEVKHWAKILTRAPASMVPGVRDIVNYLYEGHDPSLGLYGTLTRDVAEPLKPGTYTRDPGKVIQNANRAFGALTGLTYEHVGQAGRFLANVVTGHEHPKGMGDLFRGLAKGTLKPPRKP